MSDRDIDDQDPALQQDRDAASADIDADIDNANDDKGGDEEQQDKANGDLADKDDKDSDDDEDKKDPVDPDAEPPAPIDVEGETKRLRNELFKEGLKNLSRTGDNVSFAYVFLDVAGKDIERLHDVLKYYPHVRYLTISENKLKSLDGVLEMHSLLHLDASQNEIKNADFLSSQQRLTHLQEVNLAQNKIKELQKLVLPRLRRLNLTDNKLKAVDSIGGHRQLEVLRLEKNKIRSLAGLDDMPRLKELYLGENKIKAWEGLSGLTSLQVLDLKLNLLKDIPESLPSLPQLSDLNLSGNQIGKLAVVDRLLQLPALQSVNVDGNPLDEEAGGDLRKAVIVRLCVRQSPDVIEYRRLLSKVNDQDFTADERAELLESLIQAADEERRRKEEEDRERREREEEERRLKLEEEERQRLEDEERRKEEEENLKIKEEQDRLDKEAALNAGQDPDQGNDGGDPQDGAEEQQADDGDGDDQT